MFRFSWFQLVLFAEFRVSIDNWPNRLTVRAQYAIVTHLCVALIDSQMIVKSQMDQLFSPPLFACLYFRLQLTEEMFA